MCTFKNIFPDIFNNCFEGACPGATVMNPDEASRKYSSMHRTCGQSRLDSPNAWCADVSAKGEWMQIDLGNVMCVNGVVTQSRKDYNQRVTSYKVSYSADGQNFTELPQVYTGNDRFDNSKKTNNFKPVPARYVRFIVQTYYGHPSMRAAVIGSATGY